MNKSGACVSGIQSETQNIKPRSAGKKIAGTGFSKQRRLLTAAAYKQVFDKPVRSSDQYYTVLARPNGLDRSRLGLAISKKKARLAVSRNRLKRIARESFRHFQASHSADYIVLAGNRCVDASNQQLFQSLEKHWQRVNKKCVEL